jgi:hypothetical protein
MQHYAMHNMHYSMQRAKHTMAPHNCVVLSVACCALHAVRCIGLQSVTRRGADFAPQVLLDVALVHDLVRNRERILEPKHAVGIPDSMQYTITDCIAACNMQQTT